MVRCSVQCQQERIRDVYCLPAECDQWTLQELLELEELELELEELELEELELEELELELEDLVLDLEEPVVLDWLEDLLGQVVLDEWEGPVELDHGRFHLADLSRYLASLQ